jgi:hypothetical protein
MKVIPALKPALLTRNEIEWLQGKIRLSQGYQRKIKSDIRKKIKIFNELEVPLLLSSGLIDSLLQLLIVTLLQLIVTSAHQKSLYFN